MSKDLSLDEEGFPDLDGPLPAKAQTGDPQEGISPPADHPSSLDWGVTAAEQRQSEPLSAKLAREQSGEVPVTMDLDSAIELVESGGSDNDGHVVAEALDGEGAALSPE